VNNVVLELFSRLRGCVSTRIFVPGFTLRILTQNSERDERRPVTTSPSPTSSARLQVTCKSRCHGARVMVSAKSLSKYLFQFLSLRLLNKRSRVRLSPENFNLDSLPGKGHLFVVANSKGWFVAATRLAESDNGESSSPFVSYRLAEMTCSSYCITTV
jgi:hypothetical protein